MIILRRSEGEISGTWTEGLATLDGEHPMATVLYRDGRIDRVDTYDLNTPDYSVLYMDEGGPDDKDRIQFTRMEDMDAIVFSGCGGLATDGNWLELDIDGMYACTTETNLLILEFGDDGAYVVYAIEDQGDCSGMLPTVKREAPTLWGRGSRTPLRVTWEG